MSFLLAIYLTVLLASIFVSSWRLAFVALATQFFISGILLFQEEGTISLVSQIQLIDLFFVRSILLPFIFIRLIRKLKIKSEFDVIPPNFVVWTIAIILILTSYWCGQTIFPVNFQSTALLGTAISGVLIGLFILANQNNILGQIIGILTFEAGIVLMEVFNHHQENLIIQLGILSVFIWSVVRLWIFLKEFHELDV